MLGVVVAAEAGELLAEENLFAEIAVKEGVRDIHLVHRPDTRDCELDDCAECALFDIDAKVSVKLMPMR